MRILIADDDVTCRNLLSRILTKWGYHVTVTSDGEAAWNELEKQDAPPLAILDWEMPGFSGLELCRRVQDRSSTNPPYLLLLTAREDKGDIVAGLDAGANDYLAKPFNKDELRARLGVGRRLLELNQQLLETQRSLEVLTRTDPLTMRMNRRAILERLDQEIAKAARTNSMVGVGLVDIDYFKNVNDKYGHSCGDRVLQTMAHRTACAIGPYDGFGRFGGDEFLVVVPLTDRSDLSVLLDRVRSSVESTIVCSGEHSIAITVSIGGAAGDARCTDELIGAADKALYQAKADGRNRVVVLPVDVVHEHPSDPGSKSAVRCKPRITVPDQQR
jgi:diguanylate cyclase (GGDEF)-like protein